MVVVSKVARNGKSVMKLVRWPILRLLMSKGKLSSTGHLKVICMESHTLTVRLANLFGLT